MILPQAGILLELDVAPGTGAVISRLPEHPEQVHHFVVRAVAEGGHSAWSETISTAAPSRQPQADADAGQFQTAVLSVIDNQALADRNPVARAATRLNVPREVTGRYQSREAIALDWNDVPGAHAYRVRVWDPAGVKWSVLPNDQFQVDFDGSQARVRFSFLDDFAFDMKEKLLFSVKAVGETGGSSWSKPIDIDLILDTPRGLSGQWQGNGLRLDWPDVPLADFYEVRFRSSAYANAQWIMLSEATDVGWNMDGSSADIDLLPNSGTFDFQVRAITGDYEVCSAWSNVFAISPLGTQGDPPPGTTPDTPPGTTPDTPPGTTPGTPPGTTPGTPPGTTPGTPPGTTPEGSGNTTPGTSQATTPTPQAHLQATPTRSRPAPTPTRTPTRRNTPPAPTPTPTPDGDGGTGPGGGDGDGSGDGSGGTGPGGGGGDGGTGPGRVIPILDKVDLMEMPDNKYTIKVYEEIAQLSELCEDKGGSWDGDMKKCYALLPDDDLKSLYIFVEIPSDVNPIDDYCQITLNGQIHWLTCGTLFQFPYLGSFGVDSELEIKGFVKFANSNTCYPFNWERTDPGELVNPGCYPGNKDSQG